MTWSQNYDPTGNPAVSTAIAALPFVVLLGSVGLLRMRIHLAALLGLAVALAVALVVYRMPPLMVAASTAYGAAYGFFPIGWLVLNAIFLYQLTVEQGRFELLRRSLSGIAPDARIQVILIAFSFGAFLEGTAGFGAPVAISAAILIQLGFRPLHACVLSLIANTAPVAFGGLGIPITTLAGVTGLDEMSLSRMVGRQLPLFSLAVPFWVVLVLSGWKGLKGVWPAALTAGLSFAVPQHLMANYHGPRLVDITSAACSIVSVVVLLRFWRPRERWHYLDGRLRVLSAPVPTAKGQSGAQGMPEEKKADRLSHRAVFDAWLPWAMLCGVIFIWGAPASQRLLSSICPPKLDVPGLHQMVQRVAPVVPAGAGPEKAQYEFNFPAATGTGILLAAVLAGFAMGSSPWKMLRAYMDTIWKIRLSLLTIAAMLAVGQVTKYSGTDATLGLALAHTGPFYPLFGTLLGWLGVAMTGSDTSSNVLFGSLQVITANQTGISPILMGAANSSGGVMGKMSAGQSIVVASTATDWFGHEGDILRKVFFHSLALAILVGLLVCLQAYVYPFTALVAR